MIGGSKTCEQIKAHNKSTHKPKQTNLQIAPRDAVVVPAKLTYDNQ